MAMAAFSQGGGRIPVGGGAAGLLRQRHSCFQTTSRGGRSRRAMEHAPVPHRRQGHPRIARRLHRRGQAGAGVGAGRVALRRDRGGRGLAARRGQRGHRRPRDGRPPRRRIPAWTRCPSRVRRRPVGRWRWPARRDSSRSPSSWAASPPPSSSTMPTPQPTAKAIQMASLANSGQVCNALSRVLVPASRATEFVDALEAELAALIGGRSVRSSHPDRSAGRAAPAGPGPRVHRGRSTAGCAPGARRQFHARRGRPRLVCATDPVRRRSTTACGSPARRSSGPCSP